MQSAFGIDHGEIYKAYDPKTGKPISPAQERADRYHKVSTTLAGLGGTAGAVGTGTGIVGHMERKGKDPMGFTMKETPYGRAPSAKVKARILGANAKAHGKQTRVAGALAAGGLGLAGAYKLAEHRQRQKLGKAWSEEGKRKTGAAAMDIGTVGVGGGAIAAGGRSAQILGEHAMLHGAHAKEAHGYLKEHKTGRPELKLTKPQVAHYKMARKVSGRVVGVKGAGALASAGIAGLGAKAIYDVGARRKSLKGQA